MLFETGVPTFKTLCPKILLIESSITVIHASWNNKLYYKQIKKICVWKKWLKFRVEKISTPIFLKKEDFRGSYKYHPNIGDFQIHKIQSDPTMFFYSRYNIRDKKVFWCFINNSLVDCNLLFPISLSLIPFLYSFA